jgi:hypothetical protein
MKKEPKLKKYKLINLKTKECFFIETYFTLNETSKLIINKQRLSCDREECISDFFNLSYYIICPDFGIVDMNENVVYYGDILTDMSGDCIIANKTFKRQLNGFDYKSEFWLIKQSSFLI